MKKQTKIIACVLAGLTLSACMKEKDPLERDYTFSAITPTAQGSRTATTRLQVTATGDRDYYGDNTFRQDIGSPTLDSAGTATYSGSARWYDTSNGKFVTGFEAITLSVNFSNRTIVSTHGGRLGINATWSRNSGENEISGAVSLTGHDNAEVDGVIGTDGILGRFINPIDFIGGFTASRR